MSTSKSKPTAYKVRVLCASLSLDGTAKRTHAIETTPRALKARDVAQTGRFRFDGQTWLLWFREDEVSNQTPRRRRSIVVVGTAGPDEVLLFVSGRHFTVGDGGISDVSVHFSFSGVGCSTC